MTSLNQKANPQHTEELEQNVIFYRGAIKETEEILGLRGTTGWNHVIETLKGKLEFIERELDRFEVMDENEIRLRLKERKDWRFMINLQDDLGKKMPQLYDALAFAEKELYNRKKNAASPHL